MRERITGAQGALVAGMLAAPLLLVFGCGPDRQEYVAANEALIQSLPVFPGAEEVERDSAPYYVNESGPASGYGTRVVYRVERDVTDQEVIDFYISELKGEWDHCTQEIPIVPIEPTGAVATATPLGFARSVNFVRENASVSVNADGLSADSGSGAYEVGVDHDAWRNFCTGEVLKES